MVEIQADRSEVMAPTGHHHVTESRGIMSAEEVEAMPVEEVVVETRPAATIKGNGIQSVHT